MGAQRQSTARPCRKEPWLGMAACPACCLQCMAQISDRICILTASSQPAAPGRGAPASLLGYVVPGHCWACRATTAASDQARQVDRLPSSRTGGSGRTPGRQLASGGGGGSRAPPCSCTTGGAGVCRQALPPLGKHPEAVLPPLTSQTSHPSSQGLRFAPAPCVQPAAAENVRLEDVESSTLRAGTLCSACNCHCRCVAAQLMPCACATRPAWPASECAARCPLTCRAECGCGGAAGGRGAAVSGVPPEREHARTGSAAVSGLAGPKFAAGGLRMQGAPRLCPHAAAAPSTKGHHAPADSLTLTLQACLPQCRRTRRAHRHTPT